MLKLLSLFSGIGAFEKALDNLNVDYELVNFCEFDKYAVKSYCAIHGVDESKNLGDITKVDETKLSKDIDILTYGFPCQDISSAGKQRGLFNEDGTLTRSGLFFDALRIIEHCQPKIAIAENVKNLVSKKFNAQFQVVLASLDSVGYNNYYAVLNAKDFGIPQNRERVFIVSIRKDIDAGIFEFPKPFSLEKRLRDVLEDSALSATDYKQPKQIIIDKSVRPGVACNFEREKSEIAKTDKDIYQACCNSGKQDNRIGINKSPTIRANNNCTYCLTANKVIRKLTPKECFRLMGFDDESFRKAEAVNSNTQLYKQAGNSIVVNVLEHLLLNVLKVLNYKEVVYDKR